jgi:16S rRNA G966 N2-methylase RsmD
MALEFFGAGSLLREAGILMMEHSKRHNLNAAAGELRRYRLLNQGDSCLSFYRKDA